MRFWCGVIVLLATLAGLLGPTAVMAQVNRLAGSYVGVAEAAGMKLELRASGGGLKGVFTDSNGVRADVNAKAVGNAVEAMLQFPKKQVKIRIFQEAVGIRMIAIPLDTAGQPVIDQTAALVFVPPGTRLPKIPAGYQPPALRVRVVDPDTFLISYPFWPAEGVAYGYESIEPRFRPIFSLFPVVMTDVLWKLCASSYKPRVMGEALRGQGVSCDAVLRAVDRMQKNRRFQRFKDDVARESKQLLVVVRCARGYIIKPSVCEPAGKTVADAAASLQTVAAVLSRY